MASEINFELALGPNDRSVFEPKVPDLVGSQSFAFLRTTGVRNAPEVLVLELFREIFFDPPSREIREKQLTPQTDEFVRGEKAVLFVARGRAKLTKHSTVEGFYAPVFPAQARAGWLRKKSDRALKQHFLQGALAHALKSASDGERLEAARLIVNSLNGQNRADSADSTAGKEILSAATAGVIVSPESGLLSDEQAIAQLVESMEFVKTAGPEQSLGDKDPLAKRITSDFLTLCRIERELPRLLWLEFLKCFLRLSAPVWVLAQMRITTLLRDWAMTAIEGGGVPNEQAIRDAVTNRWKGLFHPTTTATNEMAMHVERYMKARVELNILLYLLRANGNEGLFDQRLAITSLGSDLLTVEQLLDRFCVLGRAANKDSVRQFLIRSAETFAAWANPLRKGQGKNIDEFMRTLRRFQPFDADSGFLTEPLGSGQSIVFPGPTMIRMLLLLSSSEKEGVMPGARGKLVLADLEDHFRRYGLEFSSSAGARPRLIAELAQLGLLRGSPDAGDFTELSVPIDVSHRRAARR